MIVDRRTALAGVAAMFGAGLFAPIARAAAATGQGAPPVISEGPPSIRVFSPLQHATMTALSERVIPTTDTPGAVAAGVPDPAGLQLRLPGQVGPPAPTMSAPAPFRLGSVT